MPTIIIKLPKNLVTGKYQSSAKLEVIGSVGHGNEMQIKTNGFYNFGSRVNVKPLYVNLGAKAGSSYGRDTNDYYNAAAVSQSSVKPGSLASAIRYDLKAAGQAALFQYLPFNPAKPLIQYIERFYGFDITDPNAQGANGGGTGVPGFNLKTNRLYKDNTPNSENNVYIGYQGASGPTSVRVFVENVEVSGEYYDIGVPTANTWASEEFVFLNSSAVNVSDGEYRHYRSNVLLNPTKYLRKTISDAQPSPISVAVLDQVSNGCGDGMANVYMYTGFQCWDDEYRGVYVGNAATRGACTKLCRLPQTSWGETAATFLQIYSVVDIAERYFYMRTGKTTWLSDAGVR